MDTNEILAVILQKLNSLEAGQAETNSRLDSVDARLDGIDARFDKVDVRLDSMDARFDSMDARFDKMDTQLDNLGTGVRDINLTLENEITRRLDSLADGYKLNGEKLDGLRDVVDDLDSTVSALDVVTKFNTDQTITLKIVK